MPKIDFKVGEKYKDQSVVYEVTHITRNGGVVMEYRYSNDNKIHEMVWKSYERDDQIFTKLPTKKSAWAHVYKDGSMNVAQTKEDLIRYGKGYKTVEIHWEE
jgi:hypothetical protein